MPRLAFPSPDLPPWQVQSASELMQQEEGTSGQDRQAGVTSAKALSRPVINRQKQVRRKKSITTGKRHAYQLVDVDDEGRNADE